MDSTLRIKQQIINLVLAEMFKDFYEENKGHFTSSNDIRNEFIEYEVKSLVQNFTYEYLSIDSEGKLATPKTEEWLDQSLNEKCRKWLEKRIVKYLD